MNRTLLGFICLMFCYSAPAQVAQNVPFVNGGVKTILKYNNNLYISGQFNTIGANSTYHNIAMLDAHTGVALNWNPIPNGAVNSMIIQSGKLIVAGGFDSIAGQPRNGIAVFDAATGALDAVAPALIGNGAGYYYVQALCADSNTIYFYGGNGFFSIGQFDLTTGIVSSWQTDEIYVPLSVNTIAKSGRYIYAGGYFEGVNGNYNDVNLTRFDIITGAADTSFMSQKFNFSNGGGIYQIVPYNNHIYICGQFATFGQNPADGFLALDSSGNVTNFDIHCSNNENWAIFPQGNYLWVGGNSSVFGGRTTYYAAQIDLRTELATCWVKPNQNLDLVGAIYVQNDTVYLGGFYPFGYYPLGGDFEMAVGNVVEGPVSVNISTSSATLCPGIIDTLTAIATNAGTSRSYQWYKNGYAVGSDSQTYIDSGLNDNDSVKVVVTNLSTCQNAMGSSNYIHISLLASRNSNISATICGGTSYIFGGQTVTTSGIYYDTLTNANGCDSIITLTLSVNSPSASSICHSICSGQSYSFGGHALTTTGTYYDTLTNVNGCDSIIMLIFHVNSATGSAFSQSICSGSSYTFGSHTLSTAGTYYDTLSNASGCDSIIRLTLSVNPTLISSFSHSLCSGSSYTFGGHTLTTAGTYYDTLTNATGCDSIITLTLTVNPIHSTQSSFTICAGSSYYFHGQHLNSAGVYRDTLTGANGCDSFVYLTLNVSNILSSSLIIQLCAGDSFLYRGQELTTAGTYIDTFTSSGGCDSVFTLQIQILAASPTPVITRHGDTLFSSVTTNNFWYRNSVFILGATNNYYVITQNGNYTVRVIGQNQCFKISAAYQVLNASLDNITESSGTLIYPNPVSESFTLSVNAEMIGTAYTLTDMTGRIIHSHLVEKENTVISLDGLSSSLYILQIEGRSYKVVKE